MAFDSLSEKLNNIFSKLKKKGRLTEEDVKSATKEVKLALLEADVNFKVVKDFIKNVQERAVGADVMNGLNPAQMVIKIVNDELTALMGSEGASLTLLPTNELTVIMMVGLQGSGKTTTASKLAGQLKNKGRKPLLAAMDIYRPAAVDQLRINGEKVGVEVFFVENEKPPVIAERAAAYAKENGFDTVLFDTAGRLHIDEEMMDELLEIKNRVEITNTVLVVDSMTGQDAVKVAETFEKSIGIDGVIITKLDGDTRGGAALSIRAVTGKPILYVGMGEKLSDLEQFYPDRMASRILGMGDVLSLIEKAQASIDEEKAADMQERFKKAEFTFDDYLESINQMRSMGGASAMLSMMPGIPAGKMNDLEGAIDESRFDRIEAIIHSMTPEERANPDILNISRKNRIARGSGNDIAEVNRLVKQFGEMKKFMKKMPGMMNKGKRHGGKGLFGGLFGGLG